MISFKCVKTIESFVINGVRIDVVRASDGSTRLKVHVEPGTVCERIKRPKLKKS